MLAIRILNGNSAGKVFVLKEGKNRLGRAEGLEIQIAETGVSKEHLEISVRGDKVAFTDLRSSNGTFLNGVKVSSGTLKSGDKLGLAHILVDVIPAQTRTPVGISQSPLGPEGLQKVVSRAPVPLAPRPGVVVPAASVPSPHAMTNWTPNANVPAPFSTPMPQTQGAPIDNSSAAKKFDHYIDENFMPPLYKAAEQFEFKMILLAVLSIYVVVITVLAVVPMKQITSDSIAIESKRRAVTVARSLARGNEKVLRGGDLTQFSTESAIREDGVEDSYVMSKDGHVLAPAERVGTVTKEAGFFHDTVLKAHNREVTGEQSGRVIAAIPIMGYDAELQQNVPKAYAIVVYNPGSLSFDDGRVFSLFVQTLILAMLAATVVYFVLYRLIQHPFTRLNQLLDQALRENLDQVQLDFQLPVLQALMTNINSLLTRAGQSSQSNNNMQAGAGAKHPEFMSLLALVGYPGMLLSADGIILKVNTNFEALLGLQASQLESRGVESIPDQAMQKNMAALLDTCRAMTGQVSSDRLEIAGHQFLLSCQAMTTTSGEVECFFLTLRPAEGSEGQAA